MVQAKKALGQHFLTDPAYSKKVVDYAGIASADTVVEIGPGTGELTRFLLDAAARVVVVEFDREMVAVLRERFQDVPAGRLEILQADVLGLDWNSLDLPESFRLVGNLPYNIATRILRQSLVIRERFKSFTFMVQKEVAERILAGPGTKDYGYFTLLMEYYFERRKGFDVPRGAFRPSPKVLSHVMTLVPKTLSTGTLDYRLWESVISQAFSQRRKTLWNNLSRAGFRTDALERGFRAAGIDEKARPESVSLQQYMCLVGVL